MFKQNLLAQFSPEHLALLSPLTATSGIYRVDEKTYLRIQQIMEMLLDRFEHDPDSSHALFEYQLLTGELLLLATESVSQTPQTDSAFSDSYIGSVTQYIKDHFSEELTVSGLANTFFISRTKLSNDFKNQLGMTIGTFLMLTRIENAKLLLRQGYSVSNVAKLCGYPGTSHFIKTFKKCTLLTPLKFQQKVLGNAKE